MDRALNVLGTPLRACSLDPLTGWYRDGCCNTDQHDRGSHTVCARVTQDFLQHLQDQGNDLVTPAPHYNFPGLRPGDKWCVCASSWRQAAEIGVGCPVDLQATHMSALRLVSLELLMAHSIGEEN